MAVCLFDPITHIGGMNHIFLPGKADLKCYNEPARYGVNAMELLINKMMRLGINRKKLHAKTFGGGHLFHSIPYENEIGIKLEGFVIHFLEDEQIPIIGRDLGGVLGRKILFHTDTGDAFDKRIVSFNSSTLSAREEKALKTLRHDTAKNDESVTLFDLQG